MADFSVTVSETVSDQLARLEKRLSGQIMRKALVEITRPLVESMKDYAPEQTGALKRSIGHKTKIDRRHGRTSIKVGMKYRKTNRRGYVAGMMQERGTVNMQAQPFVQPAADEHIDDIQQQLREFVKAQLEL